MEAKTKKQKFELAKLDANNIVELDGWKEKQTAVLNDNPFIAIEDRETYEIAKQRRTALVSARTEIQKQDKHIGSFLSNFRKKTMAIAEELIAITKPAEELQQEEVSKYEQILEEKRLEKERMEEERIRKIQEKIDETKDLLNDCVEEMKFENIIPSQQEFDRIIETVDFDFEEYEVLFDEMILSIQVRLDDKVESLKEKEEQRIQQVKKDQQSKVNEIHLNVIQMIDTIAVENGGEKNLAITEQIEEMLNAKFDFDFGEFKGQFDDIREQLSIKLQERLMLVDKETERRMMIRREEHQNRINQLREGLLDKVFQMSIDDWDVELDFIDNALKQDNPFPDLKEEFEHMVKTVRKNLDQKMIIINQQLQDAERKAKEKEEQDKKLFETRVNAIKDLGFQIDEKGWKMVGSFNMSMSLDSITELTEEEWNERLIKLTADLEEIKKQDQEEKKRQKRLAKEKSQMIELVEDIHQSFDPNINWKNKEMAEIWNEIDKSLFEFVNKKVEQIKNF